MSKFLKSSALFLGLVAGIMLSAGTVWAKSTKKFQSTISEPVSEVQVHVSIGEDLAYRADHLSPKLRDRSSSRSFNDGFAGRGFYGEKDLNRLAERLERKITDRLAGKGVTVSNTAPTVLNLVITDAEPNRPTFRQLSRNTSLSYRSFGNGGAAFEGMLTSSDRELGTVSYAWFENDIRHSAFTAGTWTDANRAIERFARKTADVLKQGLNIKDKQG